MDNIGKNQIHRHDRTKKQDKEKYPSNRKEEKRKKMIYIYICCARHSCDDRIEERNTRPKQVNLI
jgi:hypothetical protein